VHCQRTLLTHWHLKPSGPDGPCGRPLHRPASRPARALGCLCRQDLTCRRRRCCYVLLTAQTCGLPRHPDQPRCDPWPGTRPMAASQSVLHCPPLLWTCLAWWRHLLPALWVWPPVFVPIHLGVRRHRAMAAAAAAGHRRRCCGCWTVHRGLLAWLRHERWSPAPLPLPTSAAAAAGCCRLLESCCWLHHLPLMRPLMRRPCADLRASQALLAKLSTAAAAQPSGWPVGLCDAAAGQMLRWQSALRACGIYVAQSMTLSARQPLQGSALAVPRYECSHCHACCCACSHGQHHRPICVHTIKEVPAHFPERRSLQRLTDASV
jgi:hypothetical protein